MNFMTTHKLIYPNLNPWGEIFKFLIKIMLTLQPRRCMYSSNFFLLIALKYTEYHWVFEKSRRIYARIHSKRSKNRLLAVYYSRIFVSHAFTSFLNTVRCIHSERS